MTDELEWSTVVLVVEPEELELAVALLWDAGVAGIEELAQPDGRIELRAGCASTVVDDVRRMLTERWTVGVQATAADAGLDEWREHAAAWRAGDRFVVVPAWQPPPDWVRPSDIALVVDPAHSFGSGSHPTTRLCLAAIERLVMPGMVVADIGCGSGVLAIAAARLAAAEVRATDIDAGAVMATDRNAARNGVGTIVRASDDLPGDLDAARFDLVVANIGAGVLRSMAVDLVALLAPDGVLVLSGVLAEQAADVVEALGAAGADVIATADEDGWVVLELRRIATD